MPDCPPGGNEKHSSVHHSALLIAPDLRVEYRGIKQHRESKTGILYAYFYCNGLAVGHGQFHQRGTQITGTECTSVMYQHEHEDDKYVLEENLPVRNEHSQYHRYKNDNGKH